MSTLRSRGARTSRVTNVMQYGFLSKPILMIYMVKSLQTHSSCL